MCGIAGYSGAFEPSLLERMSALLAHRGPDGEGVWVDRQTGVGLAHRRLAILDLTVTGAQPMASEDDSVFVVFNGEIYNHAELRDELRARGFTFRGRSDTEVLIKAYLAWGDGCFARFNGMFGSRPELIQAGSLVTLIFPLILFFLAQRFFVQGIVITGVEK